MNNYCNPFSFLSYNILLVYLRKNVCSNSTSFKHNISQRMNRDDRARTKKANLSVFCPSVIRSQFSVLCPPCFALFLSIFPPRPPPVSLNHAFCVGFRNHLERPQPCESFSITSATSSKACPSTATAAGAAAGYISRLDAFRSKQVFFHPQARVPCWCCFTNVAFCRWSY